MQYRWFPHLSKNNDEGVYLFQAELFRSGHLTLPSSEVGGGLRPWMSGTIDDRTVLVFPPGWPAVLAVGTSFLPFKVVGALAATFAVLAIHALTHELLRSRVAAVAAGAFVTLSPLMLVLGGTVLSYPFALGLGAVQLTASARAVRTERPRLLVVAGAASGLLFATRPFDAVIVSAVAALFLLLSWRRRLRSLVAAAPWTLLGAAPFVVAVLVTNLRTTGSATRFPVHANGGDNRLGFGARQISEGARVFDVTPEFMERVTRRLLGEMPHWTLAGLAVLPLVAWGAVALWRRRPAVVPPLVLLAAAFPAAYFFYWGTHFVWVGRRDYGPFYYLPMLVPMAIGVGGGFAALARRSRPVAALVAVALVATLPASIAPKYRRAERHNAAVAREIRLVEDLPRPSLVFLPVSNDGPWMLHIRGYFRNPPDLRSDRLYAADNGGFNLDLLDRFPDHTPYQLFGVLPRDVVFGDPTPVIERVRPVGGTSLRITSSFVNETDNPTVMAYVGVTAGFVRCVLDDDAIRGGRYEVTWTLTTTGPVPPPECTPLPPILANGRALGATLVVGFAASATTEIDGVNRWEYVYGLRPRPTGVEVLDPGVPSRSSAGDLGEPRADYPGAVDHVLEVDVTPG